MAHGNRHPSRRTGQNRLLLSLVVGASVGALAVATILIVWFGSAREGESAVSSPSGDVAYPPVSESQDVAEAVSPRQASASDPSTAPARAAVDDIDSTTMWQSPTSGEPLDLSYLVSGAQLIVAWRPREFLAHEEGQRVLGVLGRYGELARERLPALVGTPLENMEQVVLGLLPGEGGRLDVSLVVRTYERVDEAELVRAWNDPAIESVEGGRLARGADYAYFLPSDLAAQRIVVVSLNRASELLDGAGRPPLLRRDLEALLSASDAERHLSILLVPHFLQTEGQSLLTDELELLVEPLDKFFADEVQAALVSLHLDENLFVELRAIAGAEHNPSEFAQTLRRRVEAARSTAQSWADSRRAGGDAARLLERWPRMVELLVRYTRVEVDGRQSVLRAYLPSVAAHNLVLATRLALWQHGGGSSAESTLTATPAAEISVHDRLEQKITLRFPRDTLESALTRLGELVEVRIIILGGDLQLEGITKNQSFGLDEQEVSAREVLERILRRASPEGKLVYSVKPDPREDDASEVIYVTTRKAAVQRGDPLPAELRTDPKVPATSQP